MKKITIEVTEEQAREIAEKYGEKQGRFVPEYGQEYFYVSDGGNARSSYWRGDCIDNCHLNTGNLFRTQEEPQTHADKLHAIAKVTEYIYKNGMNVSEEEIDDIDVDKYYFHYDLGNKEVEHTVFRIIKKYSPIPYINSKENAKKLLAKFPEELNEIYN